MKNVYSSAEFKKEKLEAVKLSKKYSGDSLIKLVETKIETDCAEKRNNSIERNS